MIKTGTELQLTDLYKAIEILDGDSALTVFIHPDDWEDMYQWETVVTGYRFKYVAKSLPANMGFGEFTFIRTDAVPAGLIIVVTRDGRVETIKKDGDAEVS